MLPEGNTMYIEKLEEPGNTSMSSSHMHDYYEIYYLSSGKRRYFINHTLYDMDCGDVVFVLSLIHI